MEEKLRTILIADDETRFCRLFRRHFARHGYEVLIAADGIEALERFDADPDRIELVVTDIRMPRMSGDQLIREIRSRRDHVPIIGITGHEDLKERLAHHDSGAYYYIAKPIEDLVLMEPIVRNALRVYDYETRLAEQRQKEHQIARLLRQYILQGPPRSSSTLEIAIDVIDRSHEDGRSLRPSGDYAEWFERRSEETVFYLADASGHDDIVASFTICLSNMVLHRCHHQGHPEVEEILRFIEGAFDALRTAGVWPGNRFFTFFLGCCDTTTGDLTYVSAGHPDAFLLRSNGDGGAASLERLSSTCSPIGFNSLLGRSIEAGQTRLSPGDLLFLYSDGAYESLESHDEESVGVERLAGMVERFAGRSPRETVDGVRALLEEAIAPGEFEDDTTLMALRVRLPS